MSAQELITDHLHLWTGAVKKKSTSGRGSNGKIELTGIKKLRELILELAVRGKLVEQNPEEQPAQLVLERINQEVERQVNAGQRKKPKPTSLISDDEVPFQTPDNWIWARLGALCELENGDRSKNYPNKSALVATGIPFVNAGHIRNYEVNQDEMTFISEDRFNLLRSGKFREGDILFCLRGSLGKVGIVKGLTQGAIASSLIIARPILQHSEYLLLYLKAPLAAEMVKQYDNGTAQPNLSGKDFGSFLVPVPPEDEQNRIVQKVDELMALCDRLEQQTSDLIEAHETLVDTLLGTLTQSENATELADNWDHLSAHFDTLFTTEKSIEKLKQTILQLAVMGRLVMQDSGDEPAETALSRIGTQMDETPKAILNKRAKLGPLTDTEIPFTLLKGWKWARFIDISLNYSVGLDKGKIQQGDNKQYRYFKMNNILNTGGFQLDDIVSVDATTDEVARYSLSSDDFLFNTRNSQELVGKTCVYIHDGGAPVLYNNNVLRAKFSNKETAHFIDIWMRSTEGKHMLEEIKSGTTNVWAIYQGKLEMLPCPFPPIEEQQRIVQKVNELMALCDQLKERLNQSSETRCQLAASIVESALQ